MLPCAGLLCCGKGSLEASQRSVGHRGHERTEYCSARLLRAVQMISSSSLKIPNLIEVYATRLHYLFPSEIPNTTLYHSIYLCKYF